MGSYYFYTHLALLIVVMFDCLHLYTHAKDEVEETHAATHYEDVIVM